MCDRKWFTESVSAVPAGARTTSRLREHAGGMVVDGLSSSAGRGAGIVVGMSIPQPDPVPGVQGRSPRAIRAALLPEEAGDFDRQSRQVMREAMERWS